MQLPDLDEHSWENRKFGECFFIPQKGTLRVEYAGKRMVTVDLDPNEDVWSLKSIDNLAKIYSRAFNYASDQEVLDFEFAVREGQALVQRLCL